MMCVNSIGSSASFARLTNEETITDGVVDYVMRNQLLRIANYVRPAMNIVFGSLCWRKVSVVLSFLRTNCFRVFFAALCHSCIVTFLAFAGTTTTLTFLFVEFRER